MGRIRSVLAVAAVLLAMLAASAAPAMASMNDDDHMNNDRNLDRQDIHLDRQLASEGDASFFDPFVVSPFVVSDGSFFNSCVFDPDVCLNNDFGNIF